MSLKIYCQEAAITLLPYSSKDTASGEIIELTEENLLVETTKLAQKVQKCKHITLLCHSIGEVMRAFSSNFRIVEAAGGLVSDAQGRLLMIFRRGKWDLPKGKCEASESVETCAVREVSEECGIAENDLVRGELAGITYHIYQDPFVGDMVLKPSYWYFMKIEGECELTPQADEDIEEALWLTPTEVFKRLPATHKTLVQLIVERYINRK